MNTKIKQIVKETISPLTGELTKAANAPRGATGADISGTGASTPTFQFTPIMRLAVWDDNGTWKDQTAALTERGTTNFAEIDSFAATVDNLYIGCDVPFRGLRVNIKNANGTASVMTVNYRKDDDTWADTSDTDGTASAGATLAIDNVITWTTPTDWKKAKLSAIDSDSTAPSHELYFVQIVVSATLDTDVQVAEIVPLSAQTSRPSAFTASASVVPPRYWFDPDEVGGIEATGDNGDTLVVDWLITQSYAKLVSE